MDRRVRCFGKTWKASSHNLEICSVDFGLLLGRIAAVQRQNLRSIP